MLKELATVAAYGAAASFGRDVYRSTKNGSPLVWFGLAAFMSIAGFRMIGAGGDRDDDEAGVGAILLIIAGIIIPNAMVFIFLVATSAIVDVVRYGIWSLIGALAAISTIYLFLAAAIGLPWGRSERAEKERLWAIEDHNMQFLDQNGFQDLGLGEKIIEDSDGNRLKFKEQSDDRLLFMVVGRRNMRAAIRLDEEGRMTDYTGAVKL